MQAWLDREQILRQVGHSSGTGANSDELHGSEGGEACATCAELKQRYAEHDAWLESLQQSAEAVVSANRQAQGHPFCAGAARSGEDMCQASTLLHRRGQSALWPRACTRVARLVGAPITVRAEEQASQLGAVEIDRRHRGSSVLDRELLETV